MNEGHYRKLERMYHAAPINRYFAPVMQVSEGRAEVRLAVKPEFFHSANAIHGSVYFKALDDAAFFAAASLVDDVFMLTLSYNVYLTRPVSEGEIVAVGKVAHQSKNLIIAEAELRDAQGRHAARGSGSFMRSQVALTPEIGYL